MIRILLRRLFWAVPTLFCVVLVTFVLMRLAPGGPFDSEKNRSATAQQQLLQQYKLEGPLPVVFWDYFKDLLHGDLRVSTKYRNRTVNEIVAQTLPVSLQLGAAAFVVAMLLGTTAGIIAASSHNRWPDLVMMLGALAGISLPGFILGPLLILLFCFGLGWLPVGGWGQWDQLLMPTLALGVPYAASVARLVRGSMLEVLNQDYIRTARAKGVAAPSILWQHALKNAALPLVSYSGPLAANLLTGSLVVEQVFKVPGIGTFFVNGVMNRDVFLVGGISLIYSLLLIGMNLCSDALYSVLDRRIVVE